ncbi:MAG: hypothetical protein E4H41_07560 [Gemmatimonadales bacterium]|nr:MAG: hypothetical protein E4H41_07560 [Gemmatimonadales bacterium]
MWNRRFASPTAIATGFLLLGLGVLGCTPLGGWLYSDPTFALSGVRTTFQGSPADTLQVILTGCNLNDFNVDGLTIDGQLFVDGTAVGVLQSSKSFTMKMRDSVDVTVALQIPRADEPRVHAKGDDFVTAKYELNGRVELATPIGVRRVALLQKGDVRFDSTGAPSGWTVRNVRPCRPGQSVLPGQSVKPRVLVDTMFRPETPVIGSPGQRNDF